MIERIAKQDQIPLQWMNVSVEAYRDPNKGPGELTVFDAIRVHFEMWEIHPEQAKGVEVNQLVNEMLRQEKDHRGREVTTPWRGKT